MQSGWNSIPTRLHRLPQLHGSFAVSYKFTMKVAGSYANLVGLWLCFDPQEP